MPPLPRVTSGPIRKELWRCLRLRAAALALTALAAGCAAAEPTTTTEGAQTGAGRTATADDASPATSSATWTLPGARVFPEGIATDPDEATFYVGSTTDGAIYRGDVDDPGEAERWLDGGVDGRTTVTGLDVDDRGRLWVAGRDSGNVFVYDTATSDLLADFTAPQAQRSLLNDVVVTADAAYLTDSFRPVLFRVPLDGDEIGDLEPWLSLDGTPAEYAGGFNLNGIVATDDGETLLTVKYNSGELFRIDVASGEVGPVALTGAELRTGDGMVLDGRTLYVVRGGPGDIVPVELGDDLATGGVGPPLAAAGLALPTTIAPAGDRLLVVNSQLDMVGGDRRPTLPFTITAVAR